MACVAQESQVTNEKTDTPVSVFELREVASGRIGYGDTKYHLRLLGLAADRIDELLKQLVFVEKALVELRGAAEPTEDARSIGHSMRQCLLRKQQIPDALALSALTYLDPPTEESVGPWCDNCGQDEDAHVGPELKCPPENREAE
jgi:hypothetical protein